MQKQGNQCKICGKIGIYKEIWNILVIRDFFKCCAISSHAQTAKIAKRQMNKMYILPWFGVRPYILCEIFDVAQNVEQSRQNASWILTKNGQILILHHTTPAYNEDNKAGEVRNAIICEG